MTGSASAIWASHHRRRRVEQSERPQRAAAGQQEVHQEACHHRWKPHQGVDDVHDALLATEVRECEQDAKREPGQRRPEQGGHGDAEGCSQGLVRSGVQREDEPYGLDEAPADVTHSCPSASCSCYLWISSRYTYLMLLTRNAPLVVMSAMKPSSVESVVPFLRYTTVIFVPVRVL